MTAKRLFSLFLVIVLLLSSMPLSAWAMDNDDQRTGQSPQKSLFDGMLGDVFSPPTVSSVTPSNGATDVPLSGQIAITFDKLMNTDSGSVSLSGGISPVHSISGTWGSYQTTYTFPYQNLQANTTYTIHISGFKSFLGGDTMSPNPNTAYSFTTAAPLPTEPSLSDSHVVLDMAHTLSHTVSVSLGASGSRASRVDIQGYDAQLLQVDTDSLTADGVVSVTALAAGHTDVSFHFSGGDLSSTLTRQLCVDITGISTEYPVSLTASPAAGGQPTAMPASVLAGDVVNLSPAPAEGYQFLNWEAITPAGLSITDNSFIMPGSSVAITAHYRRLHTETPDTDTSANDDSSSDTFSPREIPTSAAPAVPPSNLPATVTTVLLPVIRNGNMTVGITEQQLRDALANAPKGANGFGLMFQIPGGSFDRQSISFPSTLYTLLKSSGARFVQVQSNLFQFSLDMQALSEIDSQTSGAISINTVPVPTPDAFPTYDITIRDGAGRSVTNLGSGAMTRAIPYKPAAGERTGTLFIRKLVDGQWVLLQDSHYADGWVTWRGNSCSIYGVIRKNTIPSFSDTSSHWARDFIDFTVSRAFMNGLTAAAFAPDTAITRSALAAALGRAANVDTKAYPGSSLGDVAAGSAFAPYIEWAVTKNIIPGTGKNRFAPDAPVTHEEMALIMINYAKSLSCKLPTALEPTAFTDAEEIAYPYRSAVTALQRAGVITGKNGKISPQANLTRAEAAAILRRFQDLTVDPAAVRGWTQTDNGQRLYYSPTTGKPLTGWQTIDGSKYYFSAKGIARTGWMNLGESRRYFYASGKMATGWVQIGGKHYYFQKNGNLTVSTTIDGYRVDAAGVRQ